MEERLQKVLAAAGVASRREAEKYILGGRVKVNGNVVKELGTKVDEKCFITVDGKPIKRERKAYYLFYKPRGVVTTMSDPQAGVPWPIMLKICRSACSPLAGLTITRKGFCF